MAASSSWDRLGQAASVMQVTGVDAFGLVAMIVQAAHTARRNRDLCQQLAQHVQIVGGLLRKLQITELRRQPETRRPLEQLDDALLRAYKLVRSCSQQQESRSQLYGIISGPAVACKLREVQEEIDRYIQLIPMITLVAAVAVARGTEEVHEDVTNSSALITPPVDDSAQAGRPVSSLREVTEFLALEDEDLPPTGLSGYHEPAKNRWHQVIEDAVNSLFNCGGAYISLTESNLFFAIP
uniref:MCAfunc domain-containing protein n=1 Tax=Oryza rufipogon TaxID=4529 RepID=A0A0E0NGM5_ORYRU